MLSAEDGSTHGDFQSIIGLLRKLSETMRMLGEIELIRDICKSGKGESKT